ncbi:acid protease [Wolfiporia cocos MD-104 SS10]|uniref:Acid protease n=1 Tax=Wolfiporia cocos (strain MD-104) TaxID=742152 RepID=A0A2H3JHI7_WOLCO|nr:acid protease [Wolfiporia cocos MD-104 SS10]
MYLKLSTRLTYAVGILHCFGGGIASTSKLVKVPASTILLSQLKTADNHSAPTLNAALKTAVAVNAGDNQTFSYVEIDTGSAIFWVGAGQKYVPGPHTQIINQTFSESYGDGYANGTVYLDRVTIGEATVKSQLIGSASYISGFQVSEPNFDGFLGLGPNGSNAHEISGYDTTPTFVQSLVSEGAIDEPVFGIYLSPLYSDSPEGDGEITFGGVDSSRLVGDISWIPLSDELHWDFEGSYFGWGDEYIVNGTVYARTDSGAPFLGIPFDPYIWLLQNTPGISADPNYGTLTFPANMSDSLPPVYIGVGDLNVTVPPSNGAGRYTIPKSLYSTLNITDDGEIHTFISTSGPDEVDLGFLFLQIVYSAYDIHSASEVANNRVGFALAASQ